jgi:3-oxoacid CoA-transferase subunit B
VIVAMEHTTKEGHARILKRCDMPLTGTRVVDRIVTEMAVIDVTSDGLLLRETAPGLTADDIQKVTEPKLRIAPDLKTISY